MTAGRRSGNGDAGGFEQRRVGNLDQPAPVETVKGGPRGRPIGPELADLDPVTLGDIGRQGETAVHAAEAVAGRPELGVALDIRRRGPPDSKSTRLKSSH